MALIIISSLEELPVTDSNVKIQTFNPVILGQKILEIGSDWKHTFVTRGASKILRRQLPTFGFTKISSIGNISTANVILVKKDTCAVVQIS